MSVHDVSLNPAYMGKTEETLLDMVDALGAAADIASMLSIAATVLPEAHANAFGTTASILEEAIKDITGRLDTIRNRSVVP